MLKKILVITGIFLLVLVVFAVAAPFIFSGKLKSLAKKEMNEKLKAKSDFKDVNLSFFRHFPKVSVGLEDMYITGPDAFAGDTLIAANRIDVAVNLFSLFGSGPMEVTHVSLNQPRIHAIIAKDGKVNWDIMKESAPEETTDTSSSGFQMDLKKYEIVDGYIRYDDEQGNMHFTAANLNHEGSGNFSADQFRLSTSTKIDAATFTFDGVPYLNNTNTSLDADFDINTTDSKYSFNDVKLKLNEMELNTEGFFQLVNDSTYNMDIKFNTPGNDFKNILSLVPGIYTKEFKDLKTSGTAAFNGFVKGIYTTGKMPAYNVTANIRNGSFQYPELPQPVQDINLDVKAANVDGQPDNMVIEIPQATLKFGKEPFQFRLLYKQPETAQYVDMAAKGKLDLGTIGQFIKLEGDTKIGGQVNADIEAKGNLNVVLQQKPGPFQAKGLIQLINLMYASKEFPQPIKNTNATIEVSNPDGVPDHTVVNIPAGHAEFGDDKVDFTLHLTNPATDPAVDGSVKGGFQLDRVKQFYTFDEGESLSGRLAADVSFKGRKSMVDQEKYDAIQTSGNVQLSNVLYKTKDYPAGLALRTANLNFTPKDISISNANGSFQQTNFQADGRITNAIGYALKDEPLSGTMNLAADKINLNKWMGTPTSTPEQPAEEGPSKPFEVPANINFKLNANAGEVVYDQVSYKDVKGGVTIANETVNLQDLTMQALGGSIGLNGSYSTRESKLKPAVSLAYKLTNLDVEQTFKSYNTIKALMPVGQFISGKINSALTLNGRLGESMMPILESLTGKGTLALLHGYISKFKPLEEISSKLNISELERIELNDLKQQFEFVNGKVLVKPFKVKVTDIEMEVGGVHGVDQSIDYLINMKVPRAKLGSQANQFITGLAGDLAKKGLPIQLGETVNLKLALGGTIKQPKLTYNLMGSSGSLAGEMEQKAKNVADSVIASTKKQAADSLEAVKQQAIKDAKKAAEEQIFGKKDTTSKGTSTPKRAEEAAKGILEGLIKKKKPAADTTKKSP
ncbi:AsmA-like C-terminal region-containing protein [Flavihumibacter solisilvae]|uniref:AsmA domain-containing protein n=1 Tax=Flavihumibacter solisilvae TaxID=1349421 RepID=A0A0C1IT74_9BACT|nr:AsmA-like C-terminal region-containing protein [Flavihumibacter solisilvae]KIC93629.1 hypothetical protein OI18_15785 [Flavihumibacter solisilvae]